jgi:hypothetical protein
LGDRNVVAADLIAVAKLVHANEIRNGRVQRSGVAVECPFA